MTQIQDIIPFNVGGIVSLTGAGGKTSFMFHLAAVLADAGKRVLTTTTTHIFRPTPFQSGKVIVSDSVDELLEMAASSMNQSNHITAAARFAKDNKLKGYSLEAVDTIEQSNIFDWIIIEADGAARRSLKAPADHEPVIPENTAIWIGVAGLDIIGQPLSENSVFRAELFSQRIGVPFGELINEIHLSRLALHPLGLLKGVPTDALRCLFLNKADDKRTLACGRKIADHIRRTESGQLNHVIIGQAKDGIVVHDRFSLKGPVANHDTKILK